MISPHDLEAPMRTFSCLAALAFIVSPQSPLRAQSDTTRTPEVRTAGSAQQSVEPDLATVSVQFSAPGSTPALAATHLAARADSLRRALATLGITADSLISRTRWYWWNNRIERRPASRCVPRATGRPGDPFCDVVWDTTYIANDGIEVRMHDLKRVGAVLDTLMGRGITDISEVRFSATDVRAAQDEALREATVRARAQAEIIASAGGMKLGRVLSLTTESDYSRQLFSIEGTVVSAGTSPATVVTHPSLPVSVTVYGRWELVPKP